MIIEKSYKKNNGKCLLLISFPAPLRGNSIIGFLMTLSHRKIELRGLVILIDKYNFTNIINVITIFRREL